jgi:hypothetical protein
MKRIQERIKRNMSLERKIALVARSQIQRARRSMPATSSPTLPLEPLQDNKYTAGNYGGRRSPDPTATAAALQDPTMPTAATRTTSRAACTTA